MPLFIVLPWGGASAARLYTGPHHRGRNVFFHAFALPFLCDICG